MWQCVCVGADIFLWCLAWWLCFLLLQGVWLFSLMRNNTIFLSLKILHYVVTTSQRLWPGGDRRIHVMQQKIFFDIFAAYYFWIKHSHIIHPAQGYRGGRSLSQFSYSIFIYLEPTHKNSPHQHLWQMENHQLTSLSCVGAAGGTGTGRTNSAHKGCRLVEARSFLLLGDQDCAASD